MSIVKMRRLRLLAMMEDREALMREIQHLGCLEIDEPARTDDTTGLEGLRRLDSVELEKLKGETEALRPSLRTPDDYVPHKGGLFSPRPEITEEQLFDEEKHSAVLTAVAEINRHSERRLPFEMNRAG